MNAIGVGTLCLIVDPHELAGGTCITTSCEKFGEYLIDARELQPIPSEHVYEISPVRLPPEFAEFPRDGWVAKRSELVPLTPPSAPRIVIARKRAPEGVTR